MTRERSLTKLELVHAHVGGVPGWVDARWERSDGSKGSAAAHFRHKKAEQLYIAQLLVTLPTGALLRDVPLARIEAAANADPRIRKWVENAAPADVVRVAHSAAAKRPRLERPKGRRLDDGFYERVAAAYTAAVANGLHPAKTLAEDSDTPPGTVNRWIAEARNRRFLPAAERGRVTV